MSNIEVLQVYYGGMLYSLNLLCNDIQDRDILYVVQSNDRVSLNNVISVPVENWWIYGPTVHQHHLIVSCMYCNVSKTQQHEFISATEVQFFNFKMKNFLVKKH